MKTVVILQCMIMLVVVSIVGAMPSIKDDCKEEDNSVGGTTSGYAGDIGGAKNAPAPGPAGSTTPGYIAPGGKQPGAPSYINGSGTPGAPGIAGPLMNGDYLVKNFGTFPGYKKEAWDKCPAGTRVLYLLLKRVMAEKDLALLISEIKTVLANSSIVAAQDSIWTMNHAGLNGTTALEIAFAPSVAAAVDALLKQIVDPNSPLSKMSTLKDLDRTVYASKTVGANVVDDPSGTSGGGSSGGTKAMIIGGACAAGIVVMALMAVGGYKLKNKKANANAAGAPATRAGKLSNMWFRSDEDLQRDSQFQVTDPQSSRHFSTFTDADLEAMRQSGSHWETPAPPSPVTGFSRESQFTTASGDEEVANYRSSEMSGSSQDAPGWNPAFRYSDEQQFDSNPYKSAYQSSFVDSEILQNVRESFYDDDEPEF